MKNDIFGKFNHFGFFQQKKNIPRPEYHYQQRSIVNKDILNMFGKNRSKAR